MRFHVSRRSRTKTSKVKVLSVTQLRPNQETPGLTGRLFRDRIPLMTLESLLQPVQQDRKPIWLQVDVLPTIHRAVQPIKDDLGCRDEAVQILCTVPKFFHLRQLFSELTYLTVTTSFLATRYFSAIHLYIFSLFYNRTF